jgi:hypothetical protein
MASGVTRSFPKNRGAAANSESSREFGNPTPGRSVIRSASTPRRRFFAFPSSMALDATGEMGPAPMALSRDAVLLGPDLGPQALPASTEAPHS